MKKKPSLLDIEIFVQKRTDEKQKELSKIATESDALVFDSISAHQDSAPYPSVLPPTDKDREQPAVIEDPTNMGAAASAEAAAAGDRESQRSANGRNRNNSDSLSIAVDDERLLSIIEVTDLQRDDINRLKQDMFKLKEQLRVYHSFLSNQQRKISELEKSISERSISDEPSSTGVVDANYAKLLLKNIVWLKEEKDFSSNDVARLFRAEGFDTPHPYQNWDEKVINTMYAEAKRSFL